MPFLNKGEDEVFAQRVERKVKDEQKAAQAEASKVSIHRVCELSQLKPTIKAVRDSGRTPLIVSTSENPLDYEEIRNKMGDTEEKWFSGINSAFDSYY